MCVNGLTLPFSEPESDYANKFLYNGLEFGVVADKSLIVLYNFDLSTYHLIAGGKSYSIGPFSSDRSCVHSDTV